MQAYLAGEIDDDVFRVFRLNQGIYGQRQGGHNQMVRVKIPYGQRRARPARDARLRRRDVLPRLGPPHDPPERAVPLRAARADARGAPPPRVGRAHQPRGVRRHRAQRLGLPPRRRLPLRGARHQPVGRGHQGPLPAQPDRAAPAPQVQDQLLGLRHRLRPGDVQRRRRDRGAPARSPTAPSRPASACSWPAASAPTRTRRRRSRSSPRARTCCPPSRRCCGCRTTTATATTSCAPA